MPNLIYRQAGLVLAQNSAASGAQVKALQADLRRLGYLRSGVDGNFGPGTETGVRALQFDLLNNTGKGNDGQAPVSIKDAYNKGRVAAVTGAADQALVECISDMLDDPNYHKVPVSANPKADNAAAVATVRALPSGQVPMPFLIAIMRQESGLQHFWTDAFVTVGLDNGNSAVPHAVTSRGYGIGQYTLFHHPPTAAEVADFISSPAGNVTKARSELLSKFTSFVNGPTPGTQADERIAEAGKIPLRACKYATTDARFMTDCRACATTAGLINIQANVTPWFPGARGTYPEKNDGVPVRANIGCDWPYAVRRYNGGGPLSYRYQARVLKNLLIAP